MGGRPVEHRQFPFRDLPEAGEFSDHLSDEELLRFLVPKPSNHGLTLSWVYALRKADVLNLC